MRQPQKPSIGPKLIHHLQRRGMHGIATKIAEEVSVLFQHTTSTLARQADNRASFRRARRRRCNTVLSSSVLTVDLAKALLP